MGGKSRKRGKNIKKISLLYQIVYELDPVHDLVFTMMDPGSGSGFSF